MDAEFDQFIKSEGKAADQVYRKQQVDMVYQKASDTAANRVVGAAQKYFDYKRVCNDYKD